MPYPAKASNREKKGTVQGKKQAKPKGVSATRPATGTTGRLVESGNVTGTLHWCPKEGEAWTCPQCGGSFVRGEKGWSSAV